MRLMTRTHTEPAVELRIFEGALYKMATTDVGNGRRQLRSLSCPYQVGDGHGQRRPQLKPRARLLGKVCRIGRLIPHFRASDIPFPFNSSSTTTSTHGHLSYTVVQYNDKHRRSIYPVVKTLVLDTYIHLWVLFQSKSHYHFCTRIQSDPA